MTALALIIKQEMYHHYNIIVVLDNKTCSVNILPSFFPPLTKLNYFCLITSFWTIISAGN